MVNEFGIAKTVAATIEEAFGARPGLLDQKGDRNARYRCDPAAAEAPALLDEFFTDAVAAIEQAQKSEGNLGADALADANNAWWSVSAWPDRGLMQAFVDSQPHLGISARLDHYCDEATFVDWEQASPDLPDWQTSWRHLTADGKVAELTHPSAANQYRDFPRPVEPPSNVSRSS